MTTVQQLIEYLSQFPKDMPVFAADPVQGDCENCREFILGKDVELDDRYPAVVFF